MIKNWLEKVNRHTVTSGLFVALLFGCFVHMATSTHGLPAIWIKEFEAERGKQEPSYFAAASRAISNTERMFDQKILGRMFLIDLNGLFNKVLAKKMILENNPLRNVYKMENGQLTFAYPEHEIESAVANMQMLSEACKKNGTQLLYIQWPYKVNKYDNQLPHEMKDEANQIADCFLQRLAEVDIDFLDYREVMHLSGVDYASQFYNTDHHWRTETAFTAYVYLLSFLKREYGFTYDERNVDAENFYFINMPQSFIGSQAQQTGTWFAGIDDFVYIYPKFNTSLIFRNVSIDGKPDIVREGMFEDSLLFVNALEYPKLPKPYRGNCYFNGNPALAKVTNKNIKEDKKFLFVTDSYSKPIASFMALNAKEVDVIDLRDYNKESLLAYLSDKNYDYVICAYTLNAFKGISYKQSFSFAKSTDFSMAEKGL